MARAEYKNLRNLLENSGDFLRKFLKIRSILRFLGLGCGGAQLLASTPGWLAGGTASLAPLHCKRSGTPRFFSPPELLCTALYWLVHCFVHTACIVQGPRNKGVQRVSLEKSFVLLCTDALPRCFEHQWFPLLCFVLMFVWLFCSCFCLKYRICNQKPDILNICITDYYMY